MTDWFYARKGVRSGPFPADEMRRLAQVGDISEDTLCWCNHFGSEWKPFSQTELYVRSPTDPELPPPLPVGQISNRYAWIFAFVPLVGAVIDEALVQNGTELQPTYLWIPYVVTYGVLAGLDSRMIARSGNLPKGKLPNAWWFLLAPVYLWQRARYLKQRKTYFWAWIVCFVAGIAFQQPGISSGLFVVGLPQCESEYATAEAMKVFDKIDSMIKANNKALRLSGPKQIDETKTGDQVTLRVCSGVIKGSDTRDRQIIYKFSKESDQTYVTVEIQ